MPAARKSEVLTWLDLAPPLYVKLAHDIFSADGSVSFLAGENVTARIISREDTSGSIVVMDRDAHKRVICSLRELKEGTERKVGR